MGGLLNFLPFLLVLRYSCAHHNAPLFVAFVRNELARSWLVVVHFSNFEYNYDWIMNMYRKKEKERERERTHCRHNKPVY